MTDMPVRRDPRHCCHGAKQVARSTVSRYALIMVCPSQPLLFQTNRRLDFMKLARS
jgi:hypothetical protein